MFGRIKLLILMDFVCVIRSLSCRRQSRVGIARTGKKLKAIISVVLWRWYTVMTFLFGNLCISYLLQECSSICKWSVGGYSQRWDVFACWPYVTDDVRYIVDKIKKAIVK